MRDSTAMDARGAMRKRELPDVLKHPGGFLVDLKRDREIPWGFWMQCAAIAVLGSLLFGFSLVRILPGLDAAGSGLWFTLSAGAAWVVFGPLLRVGTGLPWRVLAQACLVTMVFGEIVLMAGAVFQMGLGAKLEEGRWALWSAVFWVGLSNLAMVSALALQLAAVKIPPWRTALYWIFGLNGIGALFFYLLRGLAGGGL